MITLSKPQKKVLKAAATRPDGSVYPLPEGLKGGAALKVIKAMAGKGLIHKNPESEWQISDDGYRIIGKEPPVPTSNHAEIPKQPVRANTKKAKILAILRRPEGATVKQMAELVQWQPHTVRGFLAGTIKKKMGLQLTTEKPKKDRTVIDGVKSNRHTVYRLDYSPS